MCHWHTTADETASSPPILTFPLMGGRDTSCGLLPPRRGRIQVGGFSEESDEPHESVSHMAV